MARYKTVKCRWYENAQQENLRDLGIEDDESYVLKSIILNLDNVAFIDIYKGYCCVNFSAQKDDLLITNIKAADVKELQ